MEIPLSMFKSLLKNLVIVAPILGFFIGFLLVFRSFDSQSIEYLGTCDSSISESQFKTLLIGSVSPQAAYAFVNHANDMGNRFESESLIPKSSVIAINFEKKELTHWRDYPVIPIVHSEGLGVFYVIQDFRPEVSGTCFSVD